MRWRKRGAIASFATNWKLDRASRSTKHLIELAEDIEKRGVELRSLKEQIDTASARGAASVAVTKCNKLKSIDMYRFQASIFVK